MASSRGLAFTLHTADGIKGFSWLSSWVNSVWRLTPALRCSRLYSAIHPGDVLLFPSRICISKGDISYILLVLMSINRNTHTQAHTQHMNKEAFFFHQLIQKYSEYKTLVYGYDANFVLKGPVGLLRQAGMSGRMLMRIYSVAFPCDDGGIAIPQKAALSDSHLLTHSSGCVCVARAKNRKLGRNAVHQQGSTRQTWERSASFELAPV